MLLNKLLTSLISIADSDAAKLFNKKWESFFRLNFWNLLINSLGLRVLLILSRIF